VYPFIHDYSENKGIICENNEDFLGLNKHFIFLIKVFIQKLHKKTISLNQQKPKIAYIETTMNSPKFSIISGLHFKKR
jgi:hypothetical protein